MAEPFREQIVQAVITTLETITGVRDFGTAYPNEVQVRQELREGEQVNHRPTLLVEEASGSTFEVEVVAGGATGFRHRMELNITGFVKADAAASAQTWRRRLWNDVTTALWANSTLDGLVMGLALGPLETDEGMLAPEGEFVQPVTIVAHESLTTD